MDTISSIQQAVHILQKSQNILLITHKKIDGDGLASILALSLLLRKLQKNVTAICEDPVPDVFKFLPTTNILMTQLGSLKDFVVTVHCKEAEVDNLRYTIEDDKINIFISPKKGEISAKNISFRKGFHKYDAVVVLDSPDLESLGTIYEKNVELFFNLPVIVIDHHVNNAYYGKINIVDITASSTSEIIYEMLPYFSKTPLIDEDIATLLLAGIITDTGSFQNPNTTPRSFAVASKLVHHGARQQEIIKSIYKTKKLSTLKLWGQVLSNVKSDPIYRLVWSTLSYREVLHNEASEEDSHSIIDTLLSNAPGAEIVVLLVETEPTQVRGYVRTITPTIDSEKIISLLPGIYSYNDGSFIMNQPLFEVEKVVFDHIAAFQIKRLGIIKDDIKAIAASPKQHTTVKKEMSSPESFPVISSDVVEKKIGISLLQQIEKDTNLPEDKTN